MKKTLLLLIFTALLPCVNAFDLSTVIQEKSSAVDSVIKANNPSADSHKYNYKPVVFEITTEYFRNIYLEEEGDDYIRYNLNYKQDGLWGEGAGYYKAKCYGTLIDSDYILTHKNCIELPEMPYEDKGVPGAEVSFKPLTMTFKKDGRELVYDIKDVKDVFVDYSSGAVLLDLKGMCFHKKDTKSSNVCVRFIEWAVNTDKENFNIAKDYGTYILSNISAKDNVKDSFVKRVFFTPSDNKVIIQDVKNGLLISAGKEQKHLAGEPLFHRADSNKNILVGIRTSEPDIEKVIGYTKSNTFALFSPDFTQLIKKNADTRGGIKLTKDLNGNTSL